MTCYAGGKKRCGKEIADAIEAYMEEIDFMTDTLVVPFAGMCGVTRHLRLHFNKIHASDINGSVIKLHQANQRGDYEPPTSVNAEQYEAFKHQKEDSADKAFVGCALGMRGRYFGTYDGTDRDHLAAAARGLKRLRPFVQDVEFSKSDYKQLKEFEGVVYYCDGPYGGTRGGAYLEGFNAYQYFQWVRETSRRGNLVFVSEIKAPLDFKEIWKKSLGKHSGSKSRVEKLFVWDPSRVKRSKYSAI